MGIRGTNEGFGRLDDCVVWTRMGNGFLHEPHLTDSLHDKSFHARSFLCFVASARPTHTARRTQGTGDGVQNLTSRRGNIVYSFARSNYTLVRSHTRPSPPMFRHSCSTSAGQQDQSWRS